MWKILFDCRVITKNNLFYMHVMSIFLIAKNTIFQFLISYFKLIISKFAKVFEWTEKCINFKSIKLLIVNMHNCTCMHKLHMIIVTSRFSMVIFIGSKLSYYTTSTVCQCTLKITSFQLNNVDLFTTNITMISIMLFVV